MAKVDWEASYNAKSAEVERLKSKLETYEHGLEYVTVDAQEAAIADATHDLREEFERLKAELDKAKTQRDAMFHEIETLRGKTGYCIGCAERAIENDRLVSEIRRLRKAGDALAFILRPINEAPIAEVEAWRAAAGGGE